MDAEERAFHKRESFWLKAAAWTFGLWSLMLPITGKILVDNVKEVANEQRSMTAEFVQYRELQERRITIMEERQNFILRKLDQIDTDHRNGNAHR